MFECGLLSGWWITRVCGEQINLAEHEANKDTPVISLCLNSSYDVVEYKMKCGLITSNTHLICSGIWLTCWSKSLVLILGFHKGVLFHL